MADPKIRYDIEAGVTGDANVNRLAAELEKLDSSLDPALAERAKETTQRLRELGEQQAAIDRFVELKRATEEAAAELDKAQADAQAWARTIAATDSPTRAQTTQLLRFKAAVIEAKEQLQQQTIGLDQSRVALTALGVPTEGLAKRQADLRNEVAATAGELVKIGDTATATRGLAQIATETDAAAAGLNEAQAAITAFGAKLAASEAPTAAEAQQLQQLAEAVGRSSTALEAQAAALAQQRAALVAAGVPTDALEAKQAELATQLSTTAAQLQQLSQRGASLQAFTQLANATENAREALFLADKALDDYRASLTATGTPTAAQTQRLGALAESARQSQIAFQAAAQAQAASSAELRAAGVNVDHLAAAQAAARAETSAMAQASREAAAAAALQGRTFVSAAQGQVQAATTVREGVAGIAAQLRTLQQIAGAAVGGQLLGGLAGDVAKTADAYQNLAARIKLVTGEGAAFDRAFQGVFDIATRTNSSLESTGTLFQRIAQAGKEIKLSSEAALGLTETINQAIQVSGGSAESADAAVTQLIQGLQSGVLRGEEFNSVMEQAPRLAKALADGLNVTTGELRKQAEAGRLTSQVVIGALQGQADVVAQEFSKLPATVGRAVQNLSTEWTRYVGEVDKANGVSAAAAGAINALAGNLDALGTLLIGAGKAVAAYQALRLAQTFLGIGQAAQVAAAGKAQETAATLTNTAAQTANTAATAANTQAKLANAEAGIASSAAGANVAAMATRIAGVMSTLKTLSFVGLVTNLDTIGTALGEGIAKLMGYGKASKDLESQLRIESATAAENARQHAALAQAKQQATDKALELSKASKQLVADFEGARAKGETVADALEKIGKALQLGDLKGIKDAGAALDALALKGQITGQQVRDSLAAALDGKDLGVFQAQAQAAFDGSEQGARRLAAAVDAVTIESLRRAGTSVQELKTGFSTTANSAINDVDSLTASIDRLGAKGPEVGRALSGSLDKALDASNTERAIQAVIDRWTELGKQGLVTGDQLAAGLDKARTKLDELKPGISSLDEALKTFGLKTQSQLQQTADNYTKAWQQISTSTTTSLADKAKAFEQFKDAATAANKGIVPSSVKLQEEMFKVQLRSSEAGKALADAMDQAGGKVDSLRGRVSDLNEQLNGVQNFSIGDRNKVDKNTDKNPNPFSGQIDNSTRDTLFKKFDAGTLTADDRKAAEAALAAAQENQKLFDKAGWDNTGFMRTTDKARAVLERIASIEAAAKTPNSTSTTSTKHTVEIKLNGSTTKVNTATADDANTLTSWIKQLEAEAARS